MLKPGGTLIATCPGGEAAPRQQVRIAAWRPAMREALARHGIVRVRSGVHTAREVARYLGDRATARKLPPVPVPGTQTLGTALRDLEEQLYSWTWPYPRERLLAAGADIRAWARRENVSLEQEHPVEGTLESWAFDLPGDERAGERVAAPLAG